jgi:hypothetical protein
VLAFYQANTQSQGLASVLLVLTFIFFLAFAAFLSGWLRSAPTAAALSALALVGTAVTLVGQALNVLQSGLFFVYGAGFFVFSVAIGMAILSTSLLPKWLGWVAILIGIASATPVQGYAVTVLMLWVLAVSFLAWRRLDVVAAASDPTLQGVWGRVASAPHHHHSDHCQRRAHQR